ncbi:transposase [Streptomyces sp. AcE210]|uniref:transposase n=1 Tax=Streptomyces sp. AcE210 TaxID=2292703 RepID=UPI000E3096F1|nr:transposase [Streptomyces sp. AcE210]RFC78243.1 transposase [Streptomyces sp. AcE210]
MNCRTPWEFIRPLLPRSERGRKRLDDRTVLNGIVWKFRTGTASRDTSRRGSDPGPRCTPVRRPAGRTTRARAGGGLDGRTGRVRASRTRAVQRRHWRSGCPTRRAPAAGRRALGALGSRGTSGPGHRSVILARVRGQHR